MLIASLVVCLLFLAWILTLSELSVAMPVADGPLEYGRRAAGPELGFVMGWSMLLECQFGAVATALASGGYVAFLLNPASPDPNVIVTAGLGTVVLFFFLQAWGVKEQSKALVLMTCGAIVGLVIYWSVAATGFSWERAFPTPSLPDDKGWKATLDAIPYALWWLIIIEGVALAAEETRDPARTIPRGLVWAMLTVIVLFVLTLVLGSGAMDWRQLDGDYPLAKVVQHVTQQPVVVYGFGTIALFGLIASYHGLFYSASRQAFALGRGGFLPPFPGKVHESRQTPIAALLVSSLVTASFVVAGVWFSKAINVAILVAGMTSLIWYILAIVCLFLLRRREPALFENYRAPLNRVLPVAVVILSGFTLFVYGGINVQVIPLTAALYFAGFGYFWLVSRKRLRIVNVKEDIVSTVDGSSASGNAVSQCAGWLERIATVLIGAVVLMLGWMLIVAYRPNWARLAETELEVTCVLTLVTLTLLLVCGVALLHTRRTAVENSVGAAKVDPASATDRSCR